MITGAVLYRAAVRPVGWCNLRPLGRSVAGGVRVTPPPVRGENPQAGASTSMEGWAKQSLLAPCSTVRRFIQWGGVPSVPLEETPPVGSGSRLPVMRKFIRGPGRSSSVRRWAEGKFAAARFFRAGVCPVGWCVFSPGGLPCKKAVVIYGVPRRNWRQPANTDSHEPGRHERVGREKTQWNALPLEGHN